jgi:hypothetical protein
MVDGRLKGKERDAAACPEDEGILIRRCPREPRFLVIGRIGVKH